jgi:outer membrane protein/adhesin transport system outer membrane protein
VTRTDVAQAESRLSAAISDVTAASGTLLRSRAAYRNAVGELPGRLAAAKPLDDLPANEQETLSLARDKNPDVIAARYDELAAQDQVDVVYGQFLPTVDLEGTLQRNDNTSFVNSRTEEAVADAILKLPLYQAGLVSSQVRAAKETVSQRRKDLERVVRSTLQSATQSWELLQTARSQIRSFSEEVRAAEIALEGVRQEAQVGSRTVLDVLNAEQELLNARVNLVRAQHDGVVGSFTLRAAVGTLLASNLDLKTPLYDPGSHYDSVRGRWLPFDTDVKDQ